LVHGRDHSTRDALTALLEAFDLEVIHWREAARRAGGGVPHTGDIVKAGMEHAHAVVVLLTPDDIGYVRPHLRQVGDGQHEREPTGQARLNVVFEAGMAMGRDPSRVVLVEVGRVRPMSDVDGLSAIRMDGGLERRKDLAGRLQSVGLLVNTNGNEWQAVGSFVSGRLTEPSDGSEVNYKEKVTGEVTALRPGTHIRLIVHSPRTGLWPRPVLGTDLEGRFSTIATFGRSEQRDRGNTYTLMLVLASQADTVSFQAARDQEEAMERLPPDVQVLDQVTVRRRQL
jgi:hypothetical protein